VLFRSDERGNLKQVAKLDGVEEPYNQPRQMLPKVYWQDGYVDVTKPETVLEKKSTTGSTIIPFFIKEPAQDIDYPEDIEKAEVQLREKPRSSKSELSSLSSKDERFPS
jgi:N-acylneuraminate cytidylyltransferase